MEPDFSGYATKAGLKCSDGRTITPEAFKHMDGMEIPLVWQHMHGSVDNVLGHAVLEARDDGMYAYGYFNETNQGKTAKALVQHKDVKALSIFANSLVEKGKIVLHGVIRELSLVLAGANPGAFIENINVAHGNDIEVLAEEAIISPMLALEHEVPGGSNVEHGASDEKDAPDNQEIYDSLNDDQREFLHSVISTDSVEHADITPDSTLQEIYDSLTTEQRDLLHYMIATAVENAGTGTAAHSDSNNNTEGDLTHQEGSTLTNVFESHGKTGSAPQATLTHDQLALVVQEGQKNGSFKNALLAHAGDFGIDNIELLFPDATALTSTPQWISRRMEWVTAVLNGTKHSPFAKVKTVVADITADEARAKGYTKGNRKIEEVFGLLSRTTGPATIYKKQKLDRDDMIDITDMDVVAWLLAEMRIMIEEELARAILVGDGRSNLSSDKVKDPAGAVDGVGIRSILHDDSLYAVKKELAANVAPKDSVKGIVRAMNLYRGSGSPTLFISRSELTELLLEEDKFGRPLYADRKALADKMGVGDIVTVDLFDEYPNLYAIIVSLQDYTIGSNKGGELTSFDDFDIDFNQYKYLQETRLSGGLTKPFSAIVITKAQGTAATATAPSYNGTTKTITIPNATGVVYSILDEPVTGSVVISETTEVDASPDLGYYLATGSTDSWTYTV